MCLFSAFFCIIVELDSLLVCGAVDFHMEHVEGSKVQTMHLAMPGICWFFWWSILPLSTTSFQGASISEDDHSSLTRTGSRNPKDEGHHAVQADGEQLKAKNAADALAHMSLGSIGSIDC